MSIVMPAFNERPTIEEIIRRVLAVPIRKELVVVDDGSTDGTRDLLQQLQRELEFTLLLQPKTRGRARRCGRGSPRCGATSSSCSTTSIFARGVSRIFIELICWGAPTSCTGRGFSAVTACSCSTRATGC